jgi:hypothetical protein
VDATIVSTGAQGAERVHPLDSLLTAAAQDDVRREANAWIKSLRLVRYDGRTMRQRFHYRTDSLWWFTEIYLHKMRHLERAVATVLALEAACELDAPAQLTVRTPDPTIRAAASAFGAARRLPIAVEGAVRGGHRQQLAGFMVGPTAWLSRLRRRAARRPTRAPRVATFVHTAFWRDTDAGGAGREGYIGPVLDAVAGRVTPGDLAYVGVGPRRSFRARQWWDPLVGRTSGPDIVPIERWAPRHALRSSLHLWRQRETLAEAIVTGADIRAAGVWRGYDLWPILSDALGQAARVQWPWSARSMDEAQSALATLRPEVVVTYAEAGGWGRALMLEARRAGIPSVGLQHGFIYRHWLNYEHEADEMAIDGDDLGFPRPDRTLVFDDYASQTLVTRGHFPSTAVVTTGSPRLDQLAAECTADLETRASLRASYGVGPDERLVIVAAKFSEIEPELPALFAALGALPAVRTIVKPHPSESPGVYAPYVHDGTGVTVARTDTDLGRLLSAGDAIATMNSTVAIDGLALGIPALVVGVPTNLSPFVEAGVMIGAAGASIRTKLETLLYDHSARASLLARAARFAADYQIRADGQAARRAADEILTMSQGAPARRLAR